jgi:hypothetical protein
MWPLKKFIFVLANILNWFGILFCSHIVVDMKNMVEYSMLCPIECIDSHLTEMSLNLYRGEPEYINFVKFFLR